MDYETVSPAAFGASLTGMGLNILVRDPSRHAHLLVAVFGMTAHRVGADFAILRYGGADQDGADQDGTDQGGTDRGGRDGARQGAQVFQLHADRTYGAHPLLGLLPESPPRGAGIEIRLYDTDPDAAQARAEAAGMTVLQAATDKPHGLREVCLLCPDGYAWVASRPL